MIYLTGVSCSWGLRGKLRSIAAGFAALLLAGCAVRPDPIPPEVIARTIIEDRQTIFASQERIAGTLTLREALGRAIAYNLEHRSKMMEEALAAGQATLANYDMLPVLNGEVAKLTRSDDLASSSESILTRRQSLEPSKSSDNTHRIADLRLSWNILDFGVSYYQAKQQADRALIAQVERKKLVLKLIQQTRVAYWRAVAAQRLRGEVNDVLREGRSALQNVIDAQEAKLQSPIVSLQYRRALLEIITQLETLQQTLTGAQVELAALLNIPPATRLVLEEPRSFFNLPTIDAQISDMEMLALQNSPDIIEQMYTGRIEQAEARKAILRLLPGIEFGASANFDSNSYLVHQNWEEASARVTMNLFRLASIGSVMEVQRARENLAVTRRLAFNMAVISRVNLAQRRYFDSLTQLQRAEQIDEVEQGLAELSSTQVDANAQSAVERIRNKASAMRAALRRLDAYASAQESYGTLLQSLGLNPVPDNFQSMELSDLVRAIDTKMDPWERGQIPRPAEPPLVEPK